MTRQAFYKQDNDLLFRRLALEQFVVQYILEIRKKDPMMGMDKLWRMYRNRFSDEYRIGRDAFRCIMHERGLNIKNVRRAPRTTDSRHNLPTYPNLVKSVIPTRPNQIWVSDITYIAIEDPTARLGYRFCSLTIVMDAYSKRILGWCVAPTLEAAYSIEALKMAISTLPEGFDETLIHHSDRGTQYASSDYINVLSGSHITPSMTENGNPKDNAMAERINNTMKNVCQFATWVANSMLNQHLLRFQVEGTGSNINRWESVLKALPEEFTRTQLEQQLSSQSVETPVRTVVYQWKLAGFVEEVAEGRLANGRKGAVRFRKKV